MDYLYDRSHDSGTWGACDLIPMIVNRLTGNVDSGEADVRRELSQRTMNCDVVGEYEDDTVGLRIGCLTDAVDRERFFRS